MGITIDQIDFRYINAEFIMTNACNLKCDYCFERQRMCKDTCISFLSLDYLRGYMDLILKNRQERKIPQTTLSYINFFGGEPMLCWDNIISIIKEYEKYQFFTYSIITNGLLVTKEKLQQSKGLPILWQISIDSSNPLGNRPRFKEKQIEYTKHVLQIIKLINQYGFEVPIVSSVIDDDSVNYMFETYKYFADKKIPINWQIMLERTGDQQHLLNKYQEQCELICQALVDNFYNVPMLWANVINYYNRSSCSSNLFPLCFSEAPSPNNIYIVGPNGKLYCNTNNVNMFDKTPDNMPIGGLPNGIDIDSFKNHGWIKTLKKELPEQCFSCPSLLVNPCCIEKLFFVYPNQFTGNCNTMLSSTYYGLKLLEERRKRKL